MFYVNMASSESIGRFMHKVYAWMFAGLAVTAATSYYMFAHPAVLIYLLSSPVVFYALMALQIGLVVYMSSRITSMSYQAAVLSFLAYSSLMGVSLSPIFLVYTMSSICMTFVSAACMFGGMAIYGYYTESDLSRFSSILIMGLWGLIIASFANWFFASSGLDYILSWVGVLLFTALTAYDVQKIKLLAYSMEEDNAAGTMGSKIALLGALQLYLDFINLFLYMLKIMGRKQK